MKSRLYIWFGLIIVIVILGAWLLLFRPQAVPLSHDPSIQMATNGPSSVLIKPAETNPTPTSVNVTDTNVSSEVANIANVYHQGLISKDEAVMRTMLEKNKEPQDFYGKVIDQYGHPIAGVDVTGEIVLIENYKSESTKIYKAQSDGVGLFQFTGLKGWKFDVIVKKDGYKVGERGEGYQAPVGGKSSPSNRAILTMWKTRGAEPMKHARFEFRIPYDGTAVIFNLQTGKRAADGDFRLTLLRSPLKITPGLLHPYDWQVKIELLNGGILEETDPYPYWAPENSYQSFFETGLNSNSIPWREELRRNFYIKNAQGQYGRLFIDLSTSSTRPDTGITVEIWVNPSGSQNLEFDPAKQIQ